MAPQYTLISKLTPTTRKASLHVRATRIWEATGQKQPISQQKKVFYTGVVFVDEEDSQIMLTVWNNQKRDYFPLLEEGGVYSLFDFKVVAAKADYRHVNGDLALTFYHKTEVKAIEDTNRIPRFCFHLTDFETASNLLWATNQFLNVIGMVRDIGTLEPASNGANKLDVLLVDNRQQQMIVTLWEDKAAQFQEGLAATEGATVFVVITGLLAKQYSGFTMPNLLQTAPEIVLSSGDATKTYFNIDYTPLKALRAQLMGATTEPGTSMVPPQKKKFITTARTTLTEGTIQKILDTELSEESEVLRFLCEATIVEISTDDAWYYKACPKCPKKIRIEGDKFYCDNCSLETKGYKERFMVVVGVQDDSGKTTFTLFNKEVERLLGIPIERIIADIGQEKLTQDIPPQLNNIVGKKCAFHVKVNSYNQSGRAGYTVARLSEIITPAPKLQQPAPNTAADPSKKQRTS